MHRLSRIVSDVDAQVGRATDGATESIAQALAHMHADTTGQGEAHLGRRGGGNGGGVGGAPRVAADRGKGLRYVPCLGAFLAAPDCGRATSLRFAPPAVTSAAACAPRSRRGAGPRTTRWRMTW